jgi:hypothetical protein
VSNPVQRNNLLNGGRIPVGGSVAAGVTADYNGYSTSANVYGSSAVVGGPLLVDPAGGNFPLSAGSPEIDAGAWTRWTNLAPSTPGTMLVVSDGAVLAQGEGLVSIWNKLTPTSSNCYVSGTGSTRGSMHPMHLEHGSRVLR